MQPLIQRIRELLALARTRGSFAQNSLLMFTSSGVSIGIQFLFFPILSRIYSPEVYGIFGVFSFYTNTLGNAFTAGYNQAFVLPKKEREFASLLRLCIYISIGGFLLVQLFLMLFGQTLLSWAHHEVLGNWVYAIAPVSLLIAWDRLTIDWAIRNKEYRKQTIASTSITLSTRLFNVGFGLLVSPSIWGLMLTYALNYLLRVWSYGAYVIDRFSAVITEKLSWKEVKASASEYKEFPLFIYWGNVLNNFSNSLPVAMLPWLGFTLEQVGYYGYAQLILDLPLRLLGAGITSVYLQKASELVHRNDNSLGPQTWRLFKNMLFFSGVFLFGLILLGGPVYRIFLGEQWHEAGRLSEVLALFFFFRMLSMPLTAIFNVLRREREFFIFQVILTVVRFLSLVVGVIYTHDFIELFIIFSITNAIAYLAMSVRMFQLMGVSAWKVAGITTFASVAITTAAIALKFWWNCF